MLDILGRYFMFNVTFNFGKVNANVAFPISVAFPRVRVKSFLKKNFIFTSQTPHLID